MRDPAQKADETDLENVMRSILMHLAVATMLALTGCATTIRSNVTVFHQLQQEAGNKSFVFERSADQENNLEYQHYEDQVRVALEQHGFTCAATPAAAALRVRVSYKQTARDVTIIEPVAVDPFWYGSPFYGPTFGPYGYYGFADPFWGAGFGHPYYQQQRSTFPVYKRRLQMTISRAADNKTVYDGTVTSQGRTEPPAVVAPYMIDALFQDFPGLSGVPRRVELKMD